MVNLERKAEFLAKLPKDPKKRTREMIKWYRVNYDFKPAASRNWRIVRMLQKPRLPKYANFVRWVMVDMVRGKSRGKWGCYLFVGDKGQGKTISMVAQIERSRKDDPELYIATNFYYKYQDAAINDWTDLIKIAVRCSRLHKKCLLAVDEIHVWWDSADPRAVPGPVFDLLSFIRKYNMQLLFSSQYYEYIPKKIRRQSKYTIICKNIGELDRLFLNYYYKTVNYDAEFSGKIKKADAVRSFVADDDFYKLYDTKRMIDRIETTTQQEKDKKKQAFDLLFGDKVAVFEDSETA